MKITNYHYLKYDIDDIKQYIPNYINFVNDNYYGYNLAAIPIPGTNLYIFSFRFTLRKKEHCTNDDYIVPGNLITMDIFIGKNATRYIELPGKNFIWGRWNEIGYDTTFIFIGLFNGKSITKLSKVINIPDISSHYWDKKIKRTGVDYRIFLADGVYYLYYRTANHIITLDFDRSTFRLGIGKLILMNQENRMGTDRFEHLNCSIIKKIGDNLILIDVFDRITNKGEFNLDVMKTLEKNLPDNIFNELKKYEETIIAHNKSKNRNGIRFIEINMNTTDPIKIEYLEFKNKPGPYVHGSQTEPMFSFGTPAILIGKDMYLACGHLKIKQKYRCSDDRPDYNKDSAPFRVREYIHLLMTEMFRSNYVTHCGHGDGYVYLLYFYTIDARSHGLNSINDVPNLKIKISDAYLPINLNKDRCSDIKSSLIFSMSLFEKIINGKRTVHVTSGETDFYSSIISFELLDVINSCVHDVTDFDNYKYGYHLLPYFDDKSYDLTIDYYNLQLWDDKNLTYRTLSEFLKSVSYPYEIIPAKRHLDFKEIEVVEVLPHNDEDDKINSDEIVNINN